MEREQWNECYQGPELLWTADPNQTLVREVERLRGLPGGTAGAAGAAGTAADVGCGEGRNSVWLAEHGWRVTGVDFSDVALEKARRLAEHRSVVTVNWVLADLRSYCAPATTYDLVVVLYLHLPESDRRAVHATWARSLRPGGTMIVLGHDLTNVSGGYGGPQDPSILFTPDDVVADLSGLTGLVVERAERVDRPVVTDAGERTAIDALVRAVRA
jgi:SAM-dependent methyltransferase